MCSDCCKLLMMRIVLPCHAVVMRLFRVRLPEWLLLIADGSGVQLPPYISCMESLSSPNDGCHYSLLRAIA
jgi:hypothetical protein